MAKKKNKTQLPMSQGGLLSFGGSFESALSFSPEAVILFSVAFSLLIIFLIVANPLGL